MMDEESNLKRAEKKMTKVKVYGADWCGDTTRTREHLDTLGVQYDYIDVEQDEEASRWVKEQNDGKELKPTVDINGQVLSTPGNRELEDELRQQRVIKG
jgi:glutaredoxin